MRGPAECRVATAIHTKIPEMVKELGAQIHTQCLQLYGVKARPVPQPGYAPEPEPDEDEIGRVKRGRELGGLALQVSV